MKQEELEQLIRIITTEVLKAVTGGSPVEMKKSCDCHNSSGGEPDKCCREQNDPQVQFDGGVLTRTDVDRLADLGTSRVLLETRTIVTPLAREVASEKGIKLTRSLGRAGSKNSANGHPGKTVAIVSGREHSSQEQAVVSAVEAKGYSTRLDPASADRADAILKAAIRCAGFLTREEFCRLVVLDENVYPLAFQLGRIDGVRPAVCWDAQTASQSKKVLEANVLVLNNRLLGLPMIRKITEAWLEE
jgi:ribose 5-phosphate isomerase RpiB